MYDVHMAQTQHITEVITFSNGAPAKAKRYRCSCGSLGPRVAYFPHDKADMKKAVARAESQGAEHIETATKEN